MCSPEVLGQLLLLPLCSHAISLVIKILVSWCKGNDLSFILAIANVQVYCFQGYRLNIHISCTSVIEVQLV